MGDRYFDVSICSFHCFERPLVDSLMLRTIMSEIPIHVMLLDPSDLLIDTYACRLELVYLVLI